MSRALQCPSCGAGHEVSNPGITALSCGYCKTFFYWDAQAVHDSGVKSVLDPPTSALRVGEPATVRGQDVTVLGRVRYAHGGGVWDEWFLEAPDQEILWLTEDEKELSLEQPLAPDSRVPPFAQLRAGAELSVHGHAYVVEELGKAACLGVEGQLPFVVIPNEIYPFADLASLDGERTLGVEYDVDGAPSLYQGSFLGRDELRVAGVPALGGGVTAGQAIRCAGCGAPIEGARPPDTEMLVCPQCGAGLELDPTQIKVITRNQASPDLTLAVGDRLTLEGAAFEVVGRMVYTEIDEGETSVTAEYLLWQEKLGYRWLEEFQGHWVLGARSHRHPGVDVFFMAPKDKIRIGATTYQMVERGTTALSYVDGALPWVARVGDTYHYADLVAPPKTLSVERSAGGEGAEELEIFEGRYLPNAEMRAALGRELARPYGVAPAQPFTRGATQKLLVGVGVVFAAVNLGLLLWSLGGGRTVLHTQVEAAQYRAQHLTPPFQIRKRPAVVSIEGSAPVDNSWVGLEIGLVNANDEVCLETDGDLSYYHGVEGGESWSEGSRSFATQVRVDQPGTYRLLIYGDSGRLETPDPSSSPPLSIRVREGVVLSRYFLMMLIASLLYPAREILRQINFEKQRFGGWEADDD